MPYLPMVLLGVATTIGQQSEELASPAGRGQDGQLL
jgi:hypothetical protein